MVIWRDEICEPYSPIPSVRLPRTRDQATSTETDEMEIEITYSLPNNPFETQDDALTDTQRLIETTLPTFEIEPER